MSDLTAYKRALRKLAWPFRLLGLATVAVAAVILVAPRLRPEFPQQDGLGWTLLIAGWAICIGVIVHRTRWAKAHPFRAEP